MTLAGYSLLDRDPGLADRIVGSLAHGLFDAQIAELNGVGKRTLFDWLTKGAMIDAVEPFKSFTERYVKRCAELEEAAVASIKAAGEPMALPEWEDGAPPQKVDRGDWKATAWWLERWRPLRWGTRVTDPGVRDTWQPPQAVNRDKRAEDVFRNPTPEVLRAVARAGKMLVDAPVIIQTTGGPARLPQSSQ